MGTLNDTVITLPNDVSTIIIIQWMRKNKEKQNKGKTDSDCSDLIPIFFRFSSDFLNYDIKNAAICRFAACGYCLFYVIRKCGILCNFLIIRN